MKQIFINLLKRQDFIFPFYVVPKRGFKIKVIKMLTNMKLFLFGFLLFSFSCSQKVKTEESIHQIVLDKLIKIFPEEVHDNIKKSLIDVNKLKGLSFFNCTIYHAYPLSIPMNYEFYFISTGDKLYQINDPFTKKFYLDSLNRFINFSGIDTLNNYIGSLEFLVNNNITWNSRKIISSLRDIPGFKIDKAIELHIDSLKFISGNQSKSFTFYTWNRYSGNIMKHVIVFTRNSVSIKINSVAEGVGDFHNVTS